MAPVDIYMYVSQNPLHACTLDIYIFQMLRTHQSRYSVPVSKKVGSPVKTQLAALLYAALNPLCRHRRKLASKPVSKRLDVVSGA